MTIEPLGDQGDPAPHDHPDLVGGNRIIRRISDDYIVDDDNRGTKRISSALFKNDGRQGYLSIDSEVCIVACGREPAEYVVTPRWFGALIISVDSFRSIDPGTEPKDCWQIGMAPLSDNGCHAAVWGKITKGKSNELQRLSDWLVPIPGVQKLGDETPDEL